MQGLALFARSVALGAEAAGVGLCSAEVLNLLKEALLQVGCLCWCGERGVGGWKQASQGASCSSGGERAAGRPGVRHSWAGATAGGAGTSWQQYALVRGL